MKCSEATEDSEYIILLTLMTLHPTPGHADSTGVQAQGNGSRME